MCLYSPLISHFVSYDRQSPSFCAFALSVASESIPQSHVEAAKVLAFKEAMNLEVEALTSRRTWTLVPCPTNANVVTCKWVFTLKYHPDGIIACHKACLVAFGFTQVYGIDCTKTFSLVIRLQSIHVLFSPTVTQAWSLQQLDVYNAFLYDDLEE